MSDEIITPGSGGPASEATRKAVGGWKAMQQGNGLTRQQRILKEQEDRAQRIREGKPAEKTPDEEGYKPGSDDSSGEFNARRAKQFLNEMTKKNTEAKTFKGTPALCCAKLAMLFCGDEDIAPKSNLKIIKVEEAGFGIFKITYTCD
jgi:hypothetical protein